MELIDIPESNVKFIDDANSKVPEDTKYGWGYRHLQIVLMFFCMMMGISIRACMGVTLVAMCPNRNLNATLYPMTTALRWNNNSQHVSEMFINETKLLNTYQVPTFDWDKKSQDAIQSSFFWGYVIFMIPGGMLAHHIGGKVLIISALSINAIICFFIPWAVIYGGYWWLLACRLLQGLTQSVMLPSLHTMLSKWAPPQERARMTAFVYGGLSVGAVMGISFSGFIASSRFGWPCIFWAYGATAALAAAVFAYAGANSPAQHTRISAEEKLFIRLAIHESRKNSEGKVPVPWRRILTSRGMWAIAAAHISDSWGQITLYSQIPAYMANVMKVDIKSNGVLTALPYLLTWCMSHFYSWGSDFILQKKLLSITTIRKLANSIGCWPAAVMIASLTFIHHDNLALFEVILVATCVMEVAIRVGYQVNHIDISPRFAGSMISLSNFLANGIGSFSPMLAAYFIKDMRDQLQWRNVFFTASAVYFVANVIYVILGTAKRAEWDDEPISDSKACKRRTSKKQIT